jgi:histidine kinase
MLGELSSSLAHELNQPLTVIKTASNFFMKKIRKGEKLDEEVLFTMSSEIDRHVDRATKIMNHMREFGRKSDMMLEQLQINEVLGRAFEFFGQQLKLRGIKVAWSLEEDLPMVMGDASRLEQVFINLLMNARDAIDEKWADAPGARNDKQITVKTRTAENSVILEVSDNGKGIPEALLDRIFEPFFTTKQVGKGTGLGLSISYGIIQDCGGTIRAVSKASEGATFIITFPIPDETTNGKNALTSR